MILVWSLAALVSGFLLDLWFGDPENWPHIVRWMGRLIAALDRRLPHDLSHGVCLLLIVTFVCTALPGILLFFCYRHLPPLGYVFESLLCYQLLAAKSLQTESMKVHHCLQQGDLQGARRQLSLIVGRDTELLDEEGIRRATIETVAENTADGVVAPLFYLMLGGAPAACLYKAVNTLDSMVGYRTAEYACFGRPAARSDDILNYLPSRISALLMLAGAFILRLDGKNAGRIWRRDRRKHASPNSAQTESVCAGALKIRLAGPAVYQGQTLEKPYIGDAQKTVENDDIVRANQLMLLTSGLAFAGVLLVRLGVIFLAKR